MHNGNWNDGMYGSWWWIPMTLVMVAFWGGLIWLGLTLLMRTHTSQLRSSGAPQMATLAKPTAQEILRERFARGEIEADDYRQRVAALRTPPRT